jgi:hypothetical protein
MNKIKKIRISDFRIYTGVEEFDFTQDDSIANLVAIYAPNGYGKTSFFDAVEWSYSGKIMRLESNDILRKSLKDSDFSLQDKIVLTNRKSYQKNKRKLGKVEIETQEKTLVRRVAKRKRVGVNITDDYRPGALNVNFDQEELDGLTGTNILSQDQIDSFLRHKTPEEKFNELKLFWPHGESAVTKFNNLNYAESALIDRLKGIDRDISKAIIKINKIGSSEDSIVMINQLIESLAADENSAFSPDLLVGNFTNSEYESLLKSCMLAITEVNKKIDSQVRIGYKLDELLDDYGSYSKNVVTLENLKKELKITNYKKKLYADLRSLENYKLEVERFKLEFDKKQSDYRLLQGAKDKFFECSRELDGLLNKKKLLKFQLNNVKSKLSINQRWLNKIESSNSKMVSELLTKKEEYGQYTANKKIYFDLQRQISPIGDELSIIKVDQKINSLDVENFQEILRNLTSIINSKDWTDGFLNKYTELHPKISRFVGLTKTIEKLKVLLEGKNNEFNENNSLNDSLEKIKGWGESYVESTNVSACPLCTTKFETFNDLIEKIKSEKGSVLKIEVLQESIIELNGQLKEAVEGRAEVERELNILVGDLNSKISEQLDNLFRLRDELQNKQFPLEKKSNKLKLEISVISKFFNKYVELGGKLEEENISGLEGLLVSGIEYLDDYVARISRIVGRRRSRRDLFNNSILIDEEKVSSNDYEIDSLKESEVYQTVCELMERYGIQNLDDKTLGEVFLMDDKENSTRQTELSDVKDGIEKLNEQLLSCDCKYERSEIEGVLIDLSIKETNLSVVVKSYGNLYKEYIVSNNVSIESIESKKDVISKNKHSFESTLNNLESFQIDIKIIENALEKNLLEKDVANLKGKIPALDRTKEKIIKAKNSCIEYIQKGINNYFNKDVINQIYKRIEPHPSLTEVNFKAEVGSNGPRLLITAKGLNDEVNPNLFLSAGQVNILSLSIFLAKAFEYGSDTISTIFMDDPVQNLSDINILSFIDLLRTLTTEHNKQIVLSTHEEKFFRLLQNKLPPEYCSSKYLEFESEGKLLKENEDLIVEA